MPVIPKVILRLEERLPGATVDLGVADLSLAVSEAIEDGQRWTTDQVPATVEVCRAVPHAARMAAWGGNLFAPGLPEAFAKFEAYALRRQGGHAAFAFRLSVYQAAKRVVAHAAWLKAAVKEASIQTWPSKGKVCHPLTGETMPCSDTEALGGVPFAFGCRRLKFMGIDAASLADFISDGNDPNSVTAYLCTFLRSPEAWLLEVDFLREAANAWLSSRDLDALSASVSVWNGMQDVSPVVGDPTQLLLIPGSSIVGALEWCDAHLDMSSELLRVVGRSN